MSSSRLAATALALAAAVSLHAQGVSAKIDLPKDSPVAVLSSDFRPSNVSSRGGASLVDVHASLSLRNSSQKRIRGVTLAVYAQEVTPGGKGSVSVPSLNVAPGEAFSVRIDMPLLRPLGAAAGPSIEVKLDGVLFDDLSFYGPDTLHSRRNMTMWELEAQRDREYFKKLYETAGGEALGKEMLASLARQADRPRTGVQMVLGRATTAEPDREVKLAFLEVPEAPVEALGGFARVAANQASAPRFEVRNRSAQPVQHLEIGLIVKDQQGREFLAASMPADLNLAPSQTGQVTEDAALRLPDSVSIQGMTGFVSSVEFADGNYWIPSRSALEIPRLRTVVAPSPEEQRLSQIYKKKGLQALIGELKKF
jgi:hypothetical protein